jgi:hypothetical protein
MRYWPKRHFHSCPLFAAAQAASSRAVALTYVTMLCVWHSRLMSESPYGCTSIQ